MSPDVFANYFRCHFVTYSSDEVAGLPELATPKLTLDLRKLAEHRPRTQTLEARHDLRYRVARRERAKDMHMLCAYFHLFNRDVVRLSDLFEHLCDSLTDATFEYPFAVLRRPT